MINEIILQNIYCEIISRNGSNVSLFDPQLSNSNFNPPLLFVKIFNSTWKKTYSYPNRTLVIYVVIKSIFLFVTALFTRL